MQERTLPHPFRLYKSLDKPYNRPRNEPVIGTRITTIATDRIAASG